MADEALTKPQAPPPRRPLGLFEAFGIELEYMLVDSGTLDVLPVCDRVMEAESGEPCSSIDLNHIAWSNELVLHVLELKTAEPVPTLDGLSERFDEHLHRAQRHLDTLSGRLLPTAMHPWMDPNTQTRLWPHEYSAVYRAFDRIFGCRGHGWANLQSMHINLPFSGDDEFGRLHAAIRILLPIIPALAASSPFVGGRSTGLLDNRLEAYRNNCRRVPLVAGEVIPEAVFSIDEYHGRILKPMYDEIAAHDPEGILQHEWLNARGAIARFDRGAIEIRVIDVQECPRMDLAVARLIIELVRALVEERWCDLPAQRNMGVDQLANIFNATIHTGEQAVVSDPEFLALMGAGDSSGMTAGELWSRVTQRLRHERPESIANCEHEIDLLLREGPLARRLLNRVGRDPSHEALLAIYRRLADGLVHGEPLR